MDVKIARVQSPSHMKWIACILVAAACQRGGDKPAEHRDTPPPPTATGSARAPVTPAYKADIERLCDVVGQSGAEKLEGPDRNYTIATWLGAHLETKEAHDYLIFIQPLTGEAKASELETEARRVGLDGCALAAEWRKPTP